MNETLDKIVAEDWEHTLQEFPLFASRIGDHRFDDKLSQVREEDQLRRKKISQNTLSQLEKVDDQSLSTRERVNLEILKRQKREHIAGIEFRSYLIPITSRSGFHIYFPELPRHMRMESLEDHENYIARLWAFREFASQHVELLRQGIEEKMVLPRIVLEGYEDSIEPHIVENPHESLLFKPFANFAENVPEDEHTRLADAAAEAIRDSVVTAYRDFLAFMQDEYYPATRNDIACSELPNGKAYYEHLVHSFTTLDVTPREVHEIGCEEVERIFAEMKALIDKTGFKGDFREFVEFLRTDDRFYVENPEDLMEEVSSIVKRMEEKLPELFSRLPLIPCSIEPVPDYIAPKTTSAYYSPPTGNGARPGIYYVNTYDLKSRPLYEFEALSFHEAVPGHHLQIALQHELDDLPQFRRYGGTTAYIEGWGLYSERLGLELGFYKDPYSDFGRLTFEMWRACRLVVDTGMHYLGWSRDRAIEFMRQHSALTELNIHNEIDRYIAWPGQAIAYKMGELKIRELRAHAETKLGKLFDPRDFHDAVLEEGSVPLDVLEQQVEDYIGRVMAAKS